MKKISKNLQKRLDDIYFTVLKGQRYHLFRMEFFDRLHRFDMIIAIFASSGPLAAILTEKESLNIIALFAVVIGLVDILLATTKKAREHAVLSRRWEDLAKRIENRENLKTQLVQGDIKLFEKEADAIINDEPEIYLGLDAIAYNNVSRGSRYKTVLDVPWKVRVFKNICKFSKLKLDPKKISKK